MLAICVPVRDTVMTGFSLSLARLTAHLAETKIPFELLMENNSILVQGRERLYEQALMHKATQILWLDSDMMFPRDIYHVLNSHKESVVAATYSTRVRPYKSVAFTDEADYSKRLENTSGLHAVDSVGMGLMLIDVNVMFQLDRPLFKFMWIDSLKTYAGEDLTFCNAIRDAGFDIFVDCDLSKECAHIATGVVTMDMVGSK
jgi:hypothetical protein